MRKECSMRVFENRVQKKIFETKKDGVTREWRKLYDEELNGLYYSPNIIQVIKSRRMRCSACTMNGREERCMQGFSGET